MPTEHYPLITPKYTELNYSKAGAVQNTWYTGFEGKNVEFKGVCVGITVADETVEFKVTIDGEVILGTASQDLLFAGNRITQISTLTLTTAGSPTATTGAPAATATWTDDNDTAWLKGKNVKIEARKTTAGGASALSVFGFYYQH